MRYELSDRDWRILETVSELGQVATPHIKTLLFNDVSRVRMDKVLERHRDDKLIRRVGQRTTKGKGGTAPAVYVLGPKGWWALRRKGDYPSMTVVKEHSLHIADLFCAFVELDRAGSIKLLEDTAIEYPTDDMRVDLYLKYHVPAIRKLRRYYVEVQEHARPDLIKDKFAHHYAAWQTFIPSYEGERYPEVAFVARDDYIKARIKRLIPSNMKQLFNVYTADEFMEKATTGAAQ